MTETQTPLPPPAEVRVAVLTDLAVGGKLRENRIFTITPTGLVFDGVPTQEQWREIVAGLLHVRDAFHCNLADAVKLAKEQWGEEFVERELPQLNLPMHDAERAIAIASLDRSLRHPKLTAEHYWVLANQELALDADAQKKWADLAVEHRLSPHALVSSIHAGKLLAPGEGGASHRRALIATPAGIAQSFRLWQTQVDLPGMDRETKKATLKELRPIAAVVAELEREVGSEVAE